MLIFYVMQHIKTKNQSRSAMWVLPSVP